MAYKYSNETYKIIRVAFEVYNTLGYGFKEEVYQEAMERECVLQGIPFERQKLINLYYKGVQMDKYYQADLLCYGKIIVEIKAVADIIGEHTGQLLNYLKATGMEVGLVINFGNPDGVQHERKANFFGRMYDTTQFEATVNNHFNHVDNNGQHDLTD